VGSNFKFFMEIFQQLHNCQYAKSHRIAKEVSDQFGCGKVLARKYN